MASIRTTPPLELSPWWPKRLASVTLVAVAAAATVWLLTVQVAGVDLVVRSGSGRRSVDLGGVLAASALAGVLGGLTHRWSTRWARGPRAWTGVAVVVLVLSLAGPAGAATLGAAAALAAMHLAVGMTVIVGLLRQRPGGVA